MLTIYYHKYRSNFKKFNRIDYIIITRIYVRFYYVINDIFSALII